MTQSFAAAVVCANQPGMEGDRLNLALARIESAIARIEAASATRDVSAAPAGDRDFFQENNRLRDAVQTSLKQLDMLIGKLDA